AEIRWPDPTSFRASRRSSYPLRVHVAHRDPTVLAGDLAVATVVGKWNDAIDLDGGVWARRSERVTEALLVGE
ncbi:MAG: hypothetical protein RI568_14855, partial [Natronomonas sp.]|nr:hypothetical protein [Natronomonas sp.]